MKIFVLAAIVMMIFVAGCTTTPGGTPPAQTPPTPPAKVCRTVTTQTPFTETVCGDIAYAEPVCGLRKLNYSMTMLPKVDLCTIDGPCAGLELSECDHCRKAMSRCVMVIKNEEKVESGAWTVGANYSLAPNFMFIKDPITLTIAPNETKAFDFNQIYDLGDPKNSATCDLFILKEPTITDCIQQLKTKYECQNVTQVRNESRQVCE